MKILEKISSKIEPFIVNYIWKKIHYPSGKDDWKRSDKKIQQLLLMFNIFKKYIKAKT